MQILNRFRFDQIAERQAANLIAGQGADLAAIARVRLEQADSAKAWRPYYAALKTDAAGAALTLPMGVYAPVADAWECKLEFPYQVLRLHSDAAANAPNSGGSYTEPCFRLDFSRYEDRRRAVIPKPHRLLGTVGGIVAAGMTPNNMRPFHSGLNWPMPEVVSRGDTVTLLTGSDNVLGGSYQLNANSRLCLVGNTYPPPRQFIGGTSSKSDINANTRYLTPFERQRIVGQILTQRQEFVLLEAGFSGNGNESFTFTRQNYDVLVLGFAVRFKNQTPTTPTGATITLFDEIQDTIAEPYTPLSAIASFGSDSLMDLESVRLLDQALLMPFESPFSFKIASGNESGKLYLYGVSV